METMISHCSFSASRQMFWQISVAASYSFFRYQLHPRTRSTAIAMVDELSFVLSSGSEDIFLPRRSNLSGSSVGSLLRALPIAHDKEQPDNKDFPTNYQSQW